jgi:transposase
MKQSPDKTDFTDARLLADLSRVDYIPKVWLAPEEIRQLRRLVRHRKQLVDRRKAIKLRIRGLLRENRLKCPDAKAWTKSWFAWLTDDVELREGDRWVLEDHLQELVSLSGRIAASEARIRLHVKGDRVVDRLLQEKGVGFVTAVTMRAEIGRFDRFRSGKQLARFCSVTPRNASSGNRQADAGLIRAGNPDLRVVLIELAHRLIRMPDTWGDLGAKMLKRGKPKNVVVAAIANRWVRWLYHQMKESTAWQATSAPAPQKGAAPPVLAISAT